MANREEPVVAIPVIVKPIEIELSLRTVRIEVEDVAITGNLRDRILYEIPPIPLSIENPLIISRLYRIRDFLYHSVFHTNLSLIF